MLTTKAIDKFLLSCAAEGRSPPTIRWYREKLSKFQRQYPGQLPRNLEAIRMFMAGLTCGDETRHGYYRALSAFYHWSAEEFGIANPVDGVRPPKRSKKVMRSLSADQLCLLFNQPLTQRDQALLAFIIDTGARSGEVAHLTWPDIGTETVILSGKSGEREIPISGLTLGLLLALRDGHGDGHVFMGKRGALTSEGIYKAVHKAFQGAGLDGRPKSSPQTLRPTFAVLLIQLGADEFTLQRILGHSDIRTTKRYVDLNNSHIISQHRKFTPLQLVERYLNANEKGVTDDQGKRDGRP